MRPARFELGDSRRLHLAMPTRAEVRALAGCQLCGAGRGERCRVLGSPEHVPGMGVRVNLEVDYCHRPRVTAARLALLERSTSDPAPNGGKPHDDRPGKDADKPHPN
jgi:hypothetical protein